MKYLIAILALFVCGHAVACEIHYSAEDVVLHEIAKRGMDIPKYDILCEKLKDAGAELNVQVWDGQDGQRRIAVAMVSVTNVEQSAMSSLLRRLHGLLTSVPKTRMISFTPRSLTQSRS